MPGNAGADAVGTLPGSLATAGLRINRISLLLGLVPNAVAKILAYGEYSDPWEVNSGLEGH
jgi:hypothetical protein